MIFKSKIKIFLLFLGITLIFRFFGLFPSVIDHDESTYFVIGQGIANGKILYHDVTDIKPPGIFYIYAFVIKIFGNSITAVRIFAIFIIALTAYLIFLTKEKLLPNVKSSIASGIMYIIFISTWSYYGSSVNTEVFFNFFTAAGLYVLIRNPKTLNFISAGLIIGIGFTVKYVVIFDFSAFLIFYFLVSLINKKNELIKTLINIALSGIFFLIPFAGLNLIWYYSGHYDEFYYISYIAPGNYMVNWDFIRLIIFIGDFHLRFLPFVFFFYYVLFGKNFLKNNKQYIKLFMILWIAFDFIAILLPGNDFAHYFIQMMLPLSLFGGIFFYSGFEKPRFIKPLIKKRVGYILLFIYALLIVFFQKKDYYNQVDYPELISDYINSRTTSEDKIYTSNYEHIIYFLTNHESPTKYVHKTLLFDNRHIKALNINRDEEIKKIIDSKPAFIITREPFAENKLKDYIKSEFEIDTIFNEDIFVYKNVNHY